MLLSHVTIFIHRGWRGILNCEATPSEELLCWLFLTLACTMIRKLRELLCKHLGPEAGRHLGILLFAKHANFQQILYANMRAINSIKTLRLNDNIYVGVL
jgi:hypothetical protein